MTLAIFIVNANVKLFKFLNGRFYQQIFSETSILSRNDLSYCDRLFEHSSTHCLCTYMHVYEKSRRTGLEYKSHPMTKRSQFSAIFSFRLNYLIICAAGIVVDELARSESYCNITIPCIKV